MASVQVDAAWQDGRFLRGAILRFEGTIHEVAPAPPPGNGLVALPAFCNAHVHLDLSALKGEDLPRGSFAQWVEALVEQRRSWQDSLVQEAVHLGADELLASGTAAVADIDSTGLALGALRTTDLQGVSCREWIGQPAPDLLARTEQEIRAQESIGPLQVQRGLSPHAPYSTAPEAYDLAGDWAQQGELVLTSHLAETREERQLLADHQGPLAELFDRWKVRVPEWPCAPGVAGVLDRRPRWHRFLVVHANHPTPEDEAALLRHRPVVVYCPRSHRYFGHSSHPAARYLAAGIPVALGTDSRASNEGLDLWKEMACWREQEEEVADAAILDAATRVGREGLGLAPACLGLGQEATFQLAGCKDGGALPKQDEELLRQLVRDRMQTVATVIRGRVVAGTGKGDLRW